MRRNKIFAIAAVVTLLAGYAAHKAHTKAGMSDMLLANIEALADNETESDLDCQGILGQCVFNCPYCGISWWAWGSRLIGSHRCLQK